MDLDRLPRRIFAGILFEPWSGCWLWTNTLCRRGYGRTNSPIDRSVHRLTWKVLRGPIPDDLECDHLCRVHACCNPAHIELVTHAENIRRRVGPPIKEVCPFGHARDGTTVSSGKRIRFCRECVREANRVTRDKMRAEGLRRVKRDGKTCWRPASEVRAWSRDG